MSALENEDLIHVDGKKTLVNMSKDIVYQRLEHSMGFGSAEGHNQTFKVPQQAVEGSLPLIVTNPDQMVSKSSLDQKQS